MNSAVQGKPEPSVGIDDRTTPGPDYRPLTQQLSNDGPDHLNTRPDCGIGHRVQASRSVLALVIDDECVFAGLQGGDIVVSFRATESW
jgi:di- and tripeptidase